MDSPEKLKVMEVRSRPPNKRVIAMVKELLKDAESGRMQRLAAIWDYVDPDTGAQVCYRSRGPFGWAMIGGLEVLKAELVKDMVENPVIVDEWEPS